MKKEIKGNNQIGKGSKRRIENFNKLQSNWELINWNKKINYEPIISTKNRTT